MKISRRKIFQYLASGYMGFALAFFADIRASNWRLYAILMPVIILYSIAGAGEDKNKN